MSHTYILAAPDGPEGYGYFCGFLPCVAAKPRIMPGVFDACKVYANTRDGSRECASDLERLRIRGYPDAKILRLADRAHPASESTSPQTLRDTAKIRHVATADAHTATPGADEREIPELELFGSYGAPCNPVTFTITRSVGLALIVTRPGSTNEYVVPIGSTLFVKLLTEWCIEKGLTTSVGVVCTFTYRDDLPSNLWSFSLPKTS